ncbi:melanization protease 1-like [Macrobrachium nipponense]|uniref:melanization protease 1-like n=1 Tax=Macrobrachium nipponense TaxID=159736 RepID=UPI0030C84351
MTLHPAYDSKTYVNDIASPKTEQPIPFDVKNTVSPICLPEDPNNKYGNTEVSICGWGRTIGKVIVTITIKVYFGRLCNETHSLKDEQAGYSLRILAENILPSYHGNIHCRIYANSCGKRNTKRIITGTETLPHEYPWQVGLIFSKLNPDVFCGGSIIGPYHILTAAHCIDKPNSTYGSSFRPLAVVGLHDYRKPLAATKYLNIAKMTLHPAYDSKTYVNDIAILKTEQPIPFDVKNTVSPICLPEDPNNKYGNTEVSICGWGRTIGSDGSSNSPILLHTVMTTMPNVNCAIRWFLLRFSFLMRKFVLVPLEKAKACPVDLWQKKHKTNYHGTETLHPTSIPGNVGLIFSKLNPDVFCGGSIIGPYHILTAAHCIDKPNST